MLQLLISANILSSSPILVTLMMEVIRSTKTSVLTRATQHHIPEDGILHSSFKFQIRTKALYFFIKQDGNLFVA
jgi:hypothetical protein